MRMTPTHPPTHTHTHTHTHTRQLYIFDNGLVRFSTKQYKKVKKNSSSRHRSRFMHLTNYSVNKKSGDFEARTDADMAACTGSKWSLVALWKYLIEKEGMAQEQVDKIWAEMKSVVLRTFISAESHINTQARILAKSYTHTHTHTHTHARMHTHAHACTHRHTHTLIYVCIALRERLCMANALGR